MSTILAVSKKGKTVIACDTADYVGSVRCHQAVSPAKILTIGSSFIGCAGFTVYRNIIAHYTKNRKVRSKLADESQVLEFFVNLWRVMKDDYHFVNDRSDTNATTPFADLDAEFLVVSPSGIFKVKEILSVSRFETYCAIGSGAAHAEGALHVAFDRLPTARDVAMAAMDAALAFDGASGGEIRVHELGTRNKRVSHRPSNARRL